MRTPRIVGAVLLAAALVGTGCSSDDATESQSNATTSETAAPGIEAASYVVAPLTEEEIEGLRFVREEEKMARDVYLALHDAWGARIFDRISSAEESHMSAMETLLDRYELDDPAEGMSVGEFTDPSIQELYDEYVATGNQSLHDALLVGALIEERDIIDLRAQETTHADIERVYDRLEQGSSNHLRAFVQSLGRTGFDYEPIELGQELFDEVIAGSTSDDLAGSGRGGRYRGGRF